MSPARLTFLYPHLFKHLLATEIKAARRQCCRPPVAQAASISTGPPRQDSPFPRRHGKAVEPAIAMPAPDKPLIDKKDQPPCSDKVQSSSTSSAASSSGSPQSLAGNSEDLLQRPGDPSKDHSGVEDTVNGCAQEQASIGKGRKKKGRTTGPMETVLKAGESPQGKGDAQKKSAISPPPYMHSFDTYSIAKSLENGGFTETQSIELMKALRMLLAINHAKAREVLVSKSDVENESYLFRAACSELSTEVKNNRRAADEHMRQQRTMLQHEVDNLTQTLNQELANLEDGVKNMFNERKMAVREEEGEIQGAIQQLHLKISAKLNSDAKSDIEGVRWVIMRTAAGGLGFVAILALGMFNYVSNTKQARKEAEKRRKEEEKEKKRQIEKGTPGHTPGHTPGLAETEILATK